MLGRAFDETPIGCMMDVREPFRSKAWYALETLLRPLGLVPEESAAGGIWYGPEPPGEDGWLYLKMDPGTPDDITTSFRGQKPAVWTGGAERIPVPYSGGLDDQGDLIASAFYWLAGCDYRANRSRDQYGRVTGGGSLLEEWGWADGAPVDEYSRILGGLLRKAGLAGDFHRLPWSLCPTFDIDYLRKWRPGIIYRELIQYGLLGRGPSPRGRRLARSSWEIIAPGPDPYRAALRRILDELSRRDVRGSFFFKAGATSAHDVGYSLNGRFLRKSLGDIARAGHDVGLHPSFHAYNHPGYLARERKRLEEAMDRPLAAVRSHYLRWDDPATPRAFRGEGFDLDSTLGFPDRTGFRNGTCRPFMIWDHEAGAPSGVWEMPLALMESSLFNREGLDLEGALKRTRVLADTVRRHGGVLIALWHNVLWDEPDFLGWGEHLLATLDLASETGGSIGSLSQVFASRTLGQSGQPL
ncbi:MAG: hypothetical protein HKN29_10320 [Rhodothermales bacterium]|nr:hypothetical protein [Rhodothermales bacterium]